MSSSAFVHLAHIYLQLLRFTHSQALEVQHEYDPVPAPKQHVVQEKACKAHEHRDVKYRPLAAWAPGQPGWTADQRWSSRGGRDGPEPSVLWCFQECRQVGWPLGPFGHKWTSGGLFQSV